MIKEKLLEISLEIKLFGKYTYISLFLVMISGILIWYNSYYIKVDREITNLTYQNSLQKEKVLELKKEISILSSPQRVDRLARKKLEMEPVNYKNVKFLK